MVFSVRLSVCPSVTPFWLCSHHRIIMKISVVITNDQSEVHAKDQGQRSKVKVTEVKTQLNRFRTMTSVWFTYGDAMMLLRRGALLFFKLLCQISKSLGTKITDFEPNWAFPDCNLSYFTDGFEMMYKARSCIEEVPYCCSRSSVKCQGHTGQKNVDFDPNWAFPDCTPS